MTKFLPVLAKPGAGPAMASTDCAVRSLFGTRFAVGSLPGRTRAANRPPSANNQRSASSIAGVGTPRLISIRYHAAVTLENLEGAILQTRCHCQAADQFPCAAGPGVASVVARLPRELGGSRRSGSLVSRRMADVAWGPQSAGTMPCFRAAASGDGTQQYKSVPPTWRLARRAGGGWAVRGRPVRSGRS